MSFFSFLTRLVYPKPTNRKIFSYWNGHKNIFADPIAISNRLDTHPVYRPDVHPLIAETSKNPQAGVDAFNVCISAYRDAFQLEPYDSETGFGLIDSEVIELHGTFCLYLESLKKNIESKLTSQGYTEPTSSKSSEQTTNDSSDTGSISTDRPTEESAKSCSEPNSESGSTAA